MKLPSIRCVLGLLPLLLAPLYLRAAQSIKDLSLLGTSHVRNGAIFLVDSGGSVTIGSGATLTIASGGTIVALSGSTVTGFGDGGGGGGSGTVTSVAVSVPAFLQVNSGSPVTSAGTIAIGYSGSALPIANGGTGGTSASAARTALGLEIGTNVHPFSSALTTFATNGSGYYLSRANHSGTQTMATISDAGNAATRNVGTTTGTVAAGDDSRITGAASAAGLLAVNPSGINNGGKVDWTQLMNVPPGIADGSDDGAGGGSGTVTSVGVSVPAFLQITSGSPVTSAGTIAIGYSGSALPIANGGTGGTSASAARTALGLEIGTNVHPFSSALTTFATNGSAHYLSRANHTGTQTMATISDAGNSATRNVGTTAGTVAAGDDSRISGALQSAAVDSESERYGLGFRSTTNGGKEVLQQHGNLGSTKTIDLANGNGHAGTLNAHLALTVGGFTNTSTVLSGTVIKFLQDGTGGWNVTWGSEILGSPQINPAPDSVTIVSLVCFGDTSKVYAFSDYQPQRDVWVIPIGDETTAITTGTKVTFRAPYAARITEVRASLTTVSSSGTPTFDINEGGTSILSTKLTIDVSEETSKDATTAAVISDSAIADDAKITIDVDDAGTGATGAKISIYVTRT